MRYFATRLLGGLLIAFLLAPGMALAQTAEITGKVTDAKTGEPLPGANVRLEGTTLGAATNADGEYRILEVPPGTYTVQVSFVGYQNVRRTNVEVVGGVTKRLDFQLKQAEFEGQEIVVRAEEELVNQAATNAVRRLGREEISSLPTRDPQTYYSIQPGVTLQNGEVHVRGARSNQTDYLLEGLSSRSLLGTDNAISVIPAALEESQVLLGGYAANKGGANAGIVQQTLRTGGSTLSASAQYEGDQLADVFGDTYSYGDQYATVTVGGPVQIVDNVRFFLAGNYRETDNVNPIFWSAANLNELAGSEEGLCGDVTQPNCHPPVDKVSRAGVQDTAVAPLQWGEGTLPGLGRPREQFRFNGTLTFDFDPLRVRTSYVQTTENRRPNALPVETFYNKKRVPKQESVRRLASIQPTFFITDNTYLQGAFGFFQSKQETYDPLLGRPGVKGKGGRIPGLRDYTDRWAVADAVGIDTTGFSKPLSDEDSTALERSIYTQDWLGRFTDPPSYNFNGFDEIARPGGLETSYSRTEQSYWKARTELVSQQGAHKIRVGGQYKKWTVREWNGPNPAFIKDLNPDSVAKETDGTARTLRTTGSSYFGYDEFGNEVDSGPDGPKEPVEIAAWVNDKISYEDIIVNLGLRLNYYDMDLWEPAQGLASPLFDAGSFQVPVGGKAGLQQADPDMNILPRVGISFPISDRTTFHLQYGKFSQMPDLGNAYEGRAALGEIFAGGNFVPFPFAFDLKPVLTTQYEIGFGHQFSDFAAFDITAYYRRSDQQLTINQQRSITSDSKSGTPIPNTDAQPYNYFTNKEGDFSITKGVEVSIRTKRIGGVLGRINYTLTDARGTNSDPSGQIAAIENGVQTPSQIQPLEFMQKHQGSVVLDYRSGSDQPVWGRNWGVNLLWRFSSGRRYTQVTSAGSGLGQRGADEGPLLTDNDPRSRVPVEPLNSSSTPFTSTLDLRVERGIDIGPATATAFIYVQNLLNRKNVQNVYLRTGSPQDDGFLTNPGLSQELVASRGQDYVGYYRQLNLQNRYHYREDWGNDIFGEPRQVRIGFKISY